MNPSETLAHLERVKIVAILRGDYRGAWLDIGAALIEGGVSAMEVTFTCPDALGGVRALADRYGAQAAIGAGTVLTTDEVSRAVDAGATYMIAPNVNEAVIACCVHQGVLAIPGAFTPTEIEFAHRSGAGMVKLFPAMPIGPEYLKAIRGPFPDIPIMATGGVTLDNIPDFVKAGANAIGMGSVLVGADALKPGGLDRVRERAQRAMKQVSGSRA